MRAFLAIELSDEARAEIKRRQGRLKSELTDAKWVRPEVAHLTLVFYGEIDEATADGLRRALEPVFGSFEPFTMRLQGGGTFPPGRPARVAWVGLKAPPALLELQLAAREASSTVVELEAPRRPFHPHVTLARCRRPWNRRKVERFVQETHGPWSEPFRVDEGVLFRSVLGPRGPRYEAVARFPLARG